MKTTTNLIFLLLFGIILIACSNTYSNALQEEETLIKNFIERQGIEVVTDKPTEWKDNVYWKVPNYDNYYFHLVAVGDTTKPAMEEKDIVLLRYIQYTLDAYADTMRFWNSDDQPEPTNLQYKVSTESSCIGWQIALEHMQYSGAECKIICPSKLGFIEQNSNVIPLGYDMKIKIKRF